METQTKLPAVDPIKMVMRVMPKEEAAKLVRRYECGTRVSRFEAIRERIAFELGQGTLDRESIVFDLPPNEDVKEARRETARAYTSIRSWAKSRKIPIQVSCSYRTSVIVINKQEA